MQIITDPPTHEWDRFCTNHPDGHLLQTSTWGALKSRFGWSAERLALYTNDTVEAGAQVLFRSMPGGLTLAYVPKGPLVDWQNEQQCQVLLQALDRLCRSRRAFALKVEPDLPESSDLEARLVQLGFRASPQVIQPRRTILVDLEADEETILERMKSKTRYNIRLSERKGVRVRQASENDLAAFNELMVTTGERDGFGVHSTEYYAVAHDLLSRAGLGQLLLADFEGEPLAGILAGACGKKAWYLYGASGNANRSKMPTYALQWAAMCWARSRGCTSYDLWGVPDEDLETLEQGFTERSDGLWGVYRNKRGYGGTLVRYAGAYDRPYNKLIYWLYCLALNLRARTRAADK